MRICAVEGLAVTRDTGSPVFACEVVTFRAKSEDGAVHECMPCGARESEVRRSCESKPNIEYRIQYSFHAYNFASPLAKLSTGSVFYKSKRHIILLAGQQREVKDKRKRQLTAL